MARKNQLTRRERFIDVEGKDAFMPLSKMGEIRYDEAVIRSILKRKGQT